MKIYTKRKYNETMNAGSHPPPVQYSMHLCHCVCLLRRHNISLGNGGVKSIPTPIAISPRPFTVSTCGDVEALSEADAIFTQTGKANHRRTGWIYFMDYYLSAILGDPCGHVIGKPTLCFQTCAWDFGAAVNGVSSVWYRYLTPLGNCPEMLVPEGWLLLHYCWARWRVPHLPGYFSCRG